ncbi:MAG: hypothetical protein CVU50_05000 [Candidatus Cloacimonetes bacterium HGW-Cloacimonetes-3]|jgi:hypothetical protein|nr:MAG: hypothetical protein CVU50_05000 [Candidatus Cloacimonetes bacterium HGW-Cloacimonetes-3]
MHFSAKLFNLICLFALLVAAVGVWQINRDARFSSDDYLYSFKFNPGFAYADPATLTYEPIKSVADYFQSLSNLYQSLTGRIVPHALLQLFLLFPGWLFDLLNTLALFTLTALYASWIARRRHDLRIPLWLLSTMLFYFGVSSANRNFYLPAFSCNYIWTQLIVFVFLIPVRRLIQEDGSIPRGFWHAVLMLLLGLIAGDTNEPVVPALLLAMGVFGLWKLIKSPRTLPAWYYTGMLGLLAGFAFMYFAPGNSNRAAYETGITGTRGIGFSFANIMPIALTCLASIPVMLIGFIGVTQLKKPVLREGWLSFLVVFLFFAGTIFALLFTPFFIPRMNILFAGFLMIFFLGLFVASREHNNILLTLIILIALPAFGAKLKADSNRMNRVEQEYQLFLKQVQNCNSDSCLVNPRAYLDPLTRPNWAKPIATYYGKRYLWVKDEYAPNYLAQWKTATYQELPASDADNVMLEGLRYVNHDPYSRTLYVLLKQTKTGVSTDSLNVTLRTADLPEWLESLMLLLPKSVLNYLLPAVLVYRLQEGYMIGDIAVYALPMPIDNGHEDIFRLRIRHGEREVRTIYLQDVSFR